MSRRRAASLAELIVYCFIFSLVITVLMVTFVRAARSFHQLLSRQGIQSELRRINALLRRDVTLSDYRSVGVAPRPGSEPGTKRDAVAFVGIDTWTNRSNFDDYLKPKWNIYVMYYGTADDTEEVAPLGESTSGQLIRKEVVQAIPYPIPLTALTVDGWVASPTIGDGYKLLTRNLVTFEVLMDQIDENVRVHVSLRAEAGLTGDGTRESELIECYIDMRPENTWPPR